VVCEGELALPDVGSLPVAVKVARDVGDADIRALLREVRAALKAAAACNAVCPLLGATVLRGQPALLMPRFAGSALNLLEEDHPGGLPPALALAIGATVARALLAMHSQGAGGQLGRRRSPPPIAVAA
jgi:hypothetical protein